MTELEVPEDEFGLVSVAGMQPAILGAGRHRILTWGAPAILQSIDRRRVGRA